ncbi:metallophosphatase [Streptococcus didelphis]|uniref:Metallophosphatase n=1 Tax=Streptococcus didelphis TaxID=102886 RepID=A0ABY9LIV2_9STRE|nr:metallophosphatase [Streptococcus didelphis]WMB28046.1 metallophosphatase [Streptococcus didelphis]WMB29954.1 metallophosphatase [Streptococcus didelphis]
MFEKISLLHLNDLHSHFEAIPKLRRFLHQASSKNEQVIILDIGDNIDRSHPLTEATKGKANVELMNQLGVNYATIGNNEGIGLTKSDLNKVYDNANFQVIIGNIKDNNTQPHWAKPYKIHMSKEGTSIAFLAYTFPYYKTYDPNGWTVEDPISCLKKDLSIPEVAAADVKIILSHLGLAFDEKIANEVDGVDIIIGSHTHHLLEEGAYLKETYLAAAGKYGQYIGEIKLCIENHKISEVQILTHPTQQMLSQEAEQQEIKNLLSSGQRQLANQKLLTLKTPLTTEESLKLIMEAMKDYAEADIAIINSGLLLYPLGQIINQETLHKSLPHQMRLIRLELSQEQFKKICQEIFSYSSLLKNQPIHGMGFRGKTFGDIYSNGFTYKKGKIVYNKKVISKSQKLSLVLVDQYYFAPYFPSIKEAEVELLFPDLLREVVEKHLIHKQKAIGKESNEKGNFTRNA